MAVICPYCGRQYDITLFDFKSYIVCECGHVIKKDDLHRLVKSASLKVFVIIPARYAASRFPGKPLVNWRGKPLIQHVYETACKSDLPQAVIVATDDERIAKVVEDFGGKVVMTSAEHPSGSDRLAEAANILRLAPQDIIVNVQGDMPVFEPQIIKEVTRPFYINDSVVMATLASKIENKEEITDPNCVKVVFDKNGRALYFSRSPIPYDRDQCGATYYKHLGIYAYKKHFLDTFVNLPPSRLEQTEKLEQLRALEHGFDIYVTKTKAQAIDVNVPQDLKKLEAISVSS